MNDKQSETFNLVNIYKVLIVTGIGILAVVLYLLPNSDIATIGFGTYIKIFTISCIGLFLRSLRRKVFFGKKISLHQSMSFEVIIQLLHFLSPILPEKTFESEFLSRETRIPTESLLAWFQSRVASVNIIASLCGVLISALYGKIELVVLFLLINAAVSFFAIFKKDLKVSNLLNSTIFGIAIWAIEGSLVVFVLKDYLSVAESCSAYLLFTAVMEITPIPLAIGIAELPMLIFGSAEALWIILVFHISRAIPIAILSTIYLTRYKFKISDFFNLRILDVLRNYPEVEVLGLEDTEDTPYVSVVIPAYNESLRLPGFIDDVLKYMNEKQPEFAMEVIIVDDGSKDDTAAIAEKMVENDSRIRLLKQVPNQGKGAAVRRGMLEAKGKYSVYADADGATPITELEKFLPLMKKNEKIIIGSRKIISEQTEQKREGLRSLMGSAFYKTVNFFAVPGIKDTQCGFKLYRRDIIHKVFPRSLENGWAFDVELLYLAQLMGHAIIEVPVNWHEVEGSKINPIKDSLKMLVAIFRIRNNQGGFLNNS